jgi:MoaA/NifB/PqqE/SkfB family radical SAM enzyme
VSVHLTVTPANLDEIDKLLSRLADAGVKTISLSGSDEVSREALPGLGDAAAQKGLSLVWDLPVPYSAFHPVAVEIGQTEAAPEGAGKAWLYVEPDGDVLPTQGVNELLGNLLTDPWEAIWVSARK